jgi:hypothetical protein
MTDPALRDTGIAVMRWDTGGRYLLGMMIMRRRDVHACFVDMPPEWEARLKTLNRQLVEENADALLAIACAGLPMCDFEPDKVITADFLQQDYRAAAPGTIRHIPADRVASEPSGFINASVSRTTPSRRAAGRDADHPALTVLRWISISRWWMRIFRVVVRVLRSFEVRYFPARSAVAVGVPRRSCGYWLRA